jgi:hypothetical protein
MRSWRWLVAVALAACGPRIEPTGGTGGGSGSGGVATEAGSTTAGSVSTIDGSSMDTTTGGPTIELEGLLHFCHDCFANQHTFFHPCGSTTSWWCLSGARPEIWLCSGAYARIRGHFEGGTFFCPDRAFHVDEVLETRLCEPTDCGGTQCEAVRCEYSCYNDASCEPGDKCVSWGPAGEPYSGTRCLPVGDDPAAVGEPCTIDAQSRIDTCDADSVCLGVDPGTSQGTCVQRCPWAPGGAMCPGDEKCMLGLAVCRPACNPFDPACGPGEQCVDRGGFMCIPDVDLPLVPRHECAAGVICAPDELCIGNGFLPTCESIGCCRTLCQPSNPVCPAGTTCTSLGWTQPAVYEDIGACLE